MFYSKLSNGLFEYSDEFLNKAIKILREDKHAASRLRMTATVGDSEDSFLSESPSYLTAGEDGNQWVSVVAIKSLASRDVSSYAEAARNENAPLSPPLAMIAFQGGVSYVNMVSQMNSGSILTNVTVYRVHHGGQDGVITTTESHSYSGCQILVINKEDIGNVSLACMIVQANALTISYAPVPVGGGAPTGSYQSILSSNGGSTAPAS